MSQQSPSGNKKIGFLSRIDYGSKGFRAALIRQGFEIFQKEEISYAVLAGGVISEKDIKLEMSEWIKEQLSREKKKDRGKAEGEQKSSKKKKKNNDKLSYQEKLKLRKGELQTIFLQKVAKGLASLIPSLTIPDPDSPEKRKNMDLFIVTSPAFDGELGEIVAHLMAELRTDIRVWNKGGDRFPVLYVNKLIWVLNPVKAVWMRGDYYSTAAERVIKDKIKQTDQGSPYRFVVGCFGSSINKPKGELKYSYNTVPVLCRLEGTRVNENQVGVSVLEVPAGGDEPLVRNYSFKDLSSQELSFIVPPEKASDLQKRIIEIMKDRRFATPGILKHDLKDVTMEKILEEIKKLMELETFKRRGENWPGVTYEEAGKKYYFDLSFIQQELRYPSLFGPGPLKEDRIISLCCMHAGSIETDYDFLINDVPRHILEQKATILVNAGDTKEGMKHSLDRRGQIIAGMNNTKQEKLAANIIGSIMFKVFSEKFLVYLGAIEKDKLDQNKLSVIISDALICYNYILGNHDLWETEDGQDPLELFHVLLKDFLFEHIGRLLYAQGLTFNAFALLDIIKTKLTRKEFFSLPSSLAVSVQHPHMARAKTTSLRPQEMMEFGKRHNCQVTIGGNFHVSENVEEWDMDLGQCVCQELGTLKHGSDFERHKMKMVDQGIGFLRILSRNQRILMTESRFFGAPKKVPPIDNLAIINNFLKGMNMDSLE